MNVDDYIAGLVAQIARDARTLAEDIDHSPSRQFYVERIAAYRAEVTRLRGEPPIAQDQGSTG
jgi:hypothetical protein